MWYSLWTYWRCTLPLCVRSVMISLEYNGYYVTILHQHQGGLARINCVRPQKHSCIEKMHFTELEVVSVHVEEGETESSNRGFRLQFCNSVIRYWSHRYFLLLSTIEAISYRMTPVSKHPWWTRDLVETIVLAILYLWSNSRSVKYCLNWKPIYRGKSKITWSHRSTYSRAVKNRRPTKAIVSKRACSYPLCHPDLRIIQKTLQFYVFASMNN